MFACKSSFEEQEDWYDVGYVERDGGQEYNCVKRD